MSGYILLQPLKSKWFKLRCHGIGRYKLGLHIQSKEYWFEVPRGPSSAFKSSKSPKIAKMSLKRGNIKLCFVITLKSKRFKPQMAWNR